MSHDTFRNLARSIAPGSRPVARVHTGATGTLIPVSRDHLATWNERARSVAIGRDRSRSVAPCRLCRVDARPGASDLSANQPLLAHAFLIYFFPFKAHVRFHMYSIDYPNITFWSKADTRTLISIWGDARIHDGLDNCRRTVEVKSITKRQTVFKRIKSINSCTFGTKL